MNPLNSPLLIPVALTVVTGLGYLLGRRSNPAGKGLPNDCRHEFRRAQTASRVDEVLASQFAVLTRYGTLFSVAIFEIDYPQQIDAKSERHDGEELRQCLARALDEQARETDIATRYNGEGFVIIMPRTDLEGASISAERMRMAVEKALPFTVSGGLTVVLDGDHADALMDRAGAALQTAQHAGHNCVYFHDGERLEPIAEEILETVLL